jgi:NifU-like protein involved in Fe-S cluster formation
MSAAPLYNREILRLAASLAIQPVIAIPDGSASLRSSICGSTVSAALTIDAQQRIVAAAFTLSACAFGQASGAILQPILGGCSRGDLAALQQAMAALLAGQADSAIPPLPGTALALLPAAAHPGRHPAILLPYRAAIAAFDAAIAGTANR